MGMQRSGYDGSHPSAFHRVDLRVRLRRCVDFVPRFLGEVGADRAFAGVERRAPGLLPRSVFATAFRVADTRDMGG